MVGLCHIDCIGASPLAQGPPGPAGIRGVTGPPGVNGLAGVRGSTGLKGKQGRAGAVGVCSRPRSGASFPRALAQGWNIAPAPAFVENEKASLPVYAEARR